MDLGAGCCGSRVAENLFTGALGDFEACKQKCMEFADYGFIVHGFKGGTRLWCGVLSADETCASLNSGPGDCGSNGNDGVHSYKRVQVQ